MQNFTIEISQPCLYDTDSVKMSETENFQFFDEIIWIITGVFVIYQPYVCLSISTIVPFWFGPMWINLEAH